MDTCLALPNQPRQLRRDCGSRRIAKSVSKRHKHSTVVTEYHENGEASQVSEKCLH